ncbi:MAG TPA: MFS transporter [Nocardioidaceae bacterium]|nr:MFS transporter [Nocardioidaceae bacterium]
MITVNFFNFVGQALLVLFASRELGLSAGQIGLAFGVGAAGGLVGAVTAPKLSGRVGLGPLSTFGAVVFPGAIAIAAFADGPVWLRIAVLGLAELVGGFGVMCLDVPLNSLMAAATPDSIRSRVAGAFSTLNYGCRPLGAVLGGALGGWIGVRESLLVSAIGGALSVLWLIGSPVLRVRDLSDIEPAPLPVASGPC